MSTESRAELVERLRKMRESGEQHAAEPEAKAAPEPPPTTHSEPVEIPEGHKAYTEMFGSTASGREYAVRVFSDEDWPADLRHYIPTPDPNYIFPKRETEVLVTGLIRGKRSQLLHGPKGSGKSTLTEQVCARMNLPFIRVNMSEDSESSRIFGGVDVQEGSMKWIPGPAEVAAKAADIGCVLQIDEVSATPPGINLSMQWMLEKDGSIFIPDRIGEPEDRMIHPAPWFRVVCTDNTVLQGDTTGKYTGTNVQNEAFLDRMGASIYLGYLSESHERSIVETKHPETPKRWLSMMSKVARLIRSAYDQSQIGYTISPRGLLDWAEEALFWGDLDEGFKIVFFDKLVEDDKRVVAEHYQTATGQTIS